MFVFMRADRHTLYHKKKAKGCKEVVAPTRGTVMMPEKVGRALVTQVIGRGRGQEQVQHQPGIGK